MIASPEALVITPTRELAQQIATEMKKILGESDIKVLAVTGGRDFETQKYKLEGRSHVLIGTPGRLLDHIRKGNTDLGGVRYLVLDEVDEMLQQGFMDEALELIAMTAPEHQTMLCSATLSEEVRKLGRKLTKNCALIDINPDQATVEKIKQICLKTTDEYKNKAVAALIDRLNPYLMIVFCMSKERTKELGDWLGMQGYNVDVLHGEMSPAKRKTVMKAFRDAKIQILVASDLAARGLDVEGVTHVVNYDIPHDVGICIASLCQWQKLTECSLHIILSVCHHSHIKRCTFHIVLPLKMCLNILKHIEKLKSLRILLTASLCMLWRL